MEITAGQRVGGRFVVGERADGYGLGDTFRARDDEARDACLVKRLAVKVDARELDPRRMRQGPSLARVRAAGEEAGAGWIAFDTPEGECLARRIERLRQASESCDLAEARLLALGLCGALAPAHRGAAAHCALTPASVFLRTWNRRECDLTLTDFGWAPWLVTPTWSPPRVAGGVWFPSAPELASSPRGATPAADVFAVALILAELLARTPSRDAFWNATAGGKGALQAALDKARPGLHASLRDALVVSLDAIPAKRPKDADRLAKMFRDATWTESEPVPVAPPRRDDSPASAPPPDPSNARARVVEARSLAVSQPAPPPPTAVSFEPPPPPSPAETLIDEGPPAAPEEAFSPSDTLPLDEPPEDLGAATVPLGGVAPISPRVGAETLAYEDEPDHRTAPLPRGGARDTGGSTLDLAEAASFGDAGLAGSRGPHTIAPQSKRGVPAGVAPIAPVRPPIAPATPVVPATWRASAPPASVGPQPHQVPPPSRGEATEPLPVPATTSSIAPWQWGAAIAALLAFLLVAALLLR
ncbi:MAG: hypothetical protein U0324_36945 [Polyangiales bacterium]